MAMNPSKVRPSSPPVTSGPKGADERLEAYLKAETMRTAGASVGRGRTAVRHSTDMPGAITGGRSVKPVSPSASGGATGKSEGKNVPTYSMASMIPPPTSYAVERTILRNQRPVSLGTRAKTRE